MQADSVRAFEHGHVFLGKGHEQNERRTWIVVAVTAIMMVAEIIGGTIYGSMALVADGWHMSTHAAALSISALAYRFARRQARNPRFSFGTGKIGDLAGFTSAIVLALVAVLIGYESLIRMFNPIAISFDQAIIVAVLGLTVNLGSAWLLRPGHEHRHHDDEHDDSHHHSHDHNIHSAYLHVLADALTSILAIVALLAGRLYGWIWMDPLMGMVGAAVIAHWSFGLIRSSGLVLLDAVPNGDLLKEVREKIELGRDRVCDLHLWRLGPGHLGAIVGVVSDDPKSPAEYKARLDGVAGLSHVTIEVHTCSPDAKPQSAKGQNQ